MKYDLINETSLQGLDRIFYNRGIPPEEKEHYLNLTSSDTYDPLLLGNMRAGITLLAKTIAENARVGVLVDVDADGFTSSAALVNFLHSIYPNWVENNLVYYLHEGKQHGLSDSVNKIIKSQVDLIIVPDAGGSDELYSSDLAKNGKKLLFIDHHDFKEETYGPGIVINNQLYDYPNKTLSGVGVVYKFCCQFAKEIGIEEPYWLLDLVSVGMVADLMELTNFETAFYIREGVALFMNPLLKELAKTNEYSISKHGGLNPFTIGFYIAPFINAIVRSGTMEEKNLIFKAMLDFEGNSPVVSKKRGHKDEQVSLANEAARVCAAVKNRQNKATEDALEKINLIIEDEKLYNNKIIIVKLPRALNIDRNVLGLVANKLMSSYMKPIMLLNESEEDGVSVWAGSCRDYTYSPLSDFREFCEKMPETRYANGHAGAFGLSVAQEDFDKLICHIEDALRHIEFTSSYKVDFIFLPDFDKQIIFDICSLDNYWGKGFERPYIAIERIKLTKENTQLLSKDKNPTLKVVLENGVSLIKFKFDANEFEKMFEGNKITYLTAIGRCQLNNWNGNSYPQIEINDYSIQTRYNF